MPQGKVERGRPLEEVTKGSLEYTIRQIRQAFYRQHPDTEREYYWVEEIFADHIIVNSEALKSDEYYFVTYSRENGEYVFADRSEWQVVELTYQPQSLQERLREHQGRRFVEVNINGVQLAEAQKGKPRVILGEGAFADQVNGNGRRYRTAVLAEAVAEARQHLLESLGQGRAILLGEDMHPSSKRQSPRLTETIVAWQDVWFDFKEKVVKLKGNMIENSMGRDAIVTMDAGVLPGISLRGYGESELIELNGQMVEDVLWLRLTGFDLVMDPSFETAAVTAIESLGESTMSDMTKDKDPVQTPAPAMPDISGMTAEQVYKEYPKLAEQLLAKAKKDEEAKQLLEAKQAEEEAKKLQKLNKEREAALRKELGIDENADLQTAIAERNQRLAQLEEAENARQVDAYIAKQVEGLVAYPEWMRENFLTAVRSEGAKTIDEAKAAMAKMRSIFDKNLAELKLRQKGYGVDFVGPVLESETGIPEFARGAFEIQEGLLSNGFGQRRGLHKKTDLLPGELFAKVMLEKFDKIYKSQLMAETKQIAEAETTTDLNLPYSVVRNIMEQAYPDLIAANVFDFGTIEGSPARLYYESQFVGETGYATAVTGNNNVNAAAADTWYAFAAGHKRLAVDEATFSMQPSGGGTPLVFGVDYLIDFEEGKYLILSTGGMSIATNYDFDYTYYGVRKGENAVIERSKAQLAYITIEAAADRLAMQITKEAIVFSRSQVGWDAAMNSLNLLVKELRLLIDRNLLMMGLSKALTVANNIGGTWTASTGTAQELVQHMLAAKDKVENRHYEVNSFVMSKTRGTKLILWDGFTAAGERPGFRLQGAPGLLGWIAEVPVFTSTEFPDGWVLANHRELVQHRVQQPMQLDGPHPVYDQATAKMKANKEWYAEEFNATATPIAGKGSVVRIN